PSPKKRELPAVFLGPFFHRAIRRKFPVDRARVALRTASAPAADIRRRTRSTARWFSREPAHWKRSPGPLPRRPPQPLAQTPWPPAWVALLAWRLSTKA